MPSSISSPTLSARPPRSPRRAIGSWPPHSLPAAASSIAGQIPPGRLTPRSSKRVYYLSLEFLIGRLLIDSLSNLGLTETTRAALAELGVDLDETEEARARRRARQRRPRAASPPASWKAWRRLAIPAFGYGIRYDHGLFRQRIKDGWQLEYPENWLTFGNPWEFERPEIAYEIGFGGTVEACAGEDGTQRHHWHPGESVAGRRLRYADGRLARPPRQHAAPVVGARAATRCASTPSTAATTSARSPISAGRGDLQGPLSERRDARPARNCGCRQEYFFASASLQDLMRRHSSSIGDIRIAARQGGDPAQRHASGHRRRRADAPAGRRARPGVGEAWDITHGTFSYTNHTLLPEALESWPVPLMERLLPRHMQIIYLINAAASGRAAAKRPRSTTAASRPCR